MTSPTPECLTEFTIFPELPIELRLKIWEYAFPPRVVNIVYDHDQERYFSFNSSPPILLQIHRETRELCLKTHQLCFGTDTHPPSIYFDAAKDILLLHDDYLAYCFCLSTGSYWPATKERAVVGPLREEEAQSIQRIAINESLFQFVKKAGRHRIGPLGVAIEPLVQIFPSLKELSLIIESIDPVSRGRIRFFDVVESHSCSPRCEVCYSKDMCLDTLKAWRDTPGTYVSKIPHIRLVGAFRGGCRSGLGCYSSLVEDDADDWESDTDTSDIDLLDGQPEICQGEEVFTPIDHNSNDDDTDELVPVHEGVFPPYDQDVESSFSDHEGWANPDFVSEEELQDLKDEEQAFKKLAGIGFGLYANSQGSWMEPEYYARRRELPGRCYPVFSRDGYRA